MSIEMIVLIAAGSIGLLTVFGVIAWKLPKRLKPEKFDQNWKELQQFCKDKTTWPKAIISADQLLDKALKKRKLKGKTVGERLVSAQRMLTDNDAVWFAHNLYKKVLADEDVKLKEDDVKSALVGFRQALRDLGALESNELKNTK